MNSSLPEEPGADEQRYRQVRDAIASGPFLVEQLVPFLDDESWRVRRAAIERVSRAPLEPDQLAVLAGLLVHGAGPRLRNAAAEALALIGRPAVKEVAATLQHGDAHARKFAADVLGEMAVLEGVEPLVAAVGDVDANVRAAAAEALGKLGGARAALVLERLLSLGDPLAKLCALDGLHRMNATVALELLEPLLADRFLRRSVNRLLERCNEERAVGLLLDSTTDAGRSTRESAFAALGRRARRGGGIAGALASAVAERGERAALATAASDALNSVDDAVVEGALLVLARCPTASLVKQLAEFGADEARRAHVRATLASWGDVAGEALASVQAELPLAALPGVVPLCAQPVREAMCRRVAQEFDTQAPEAMPDLLELIGHSGPATLVTSVAEWVSDPFVGAAASRALDELLARHGAACLPTLRAAWERSPTAALCFALGRVGGDAELAEVRRATGHPEPEFRIAAARALAIRGDVSDAPALVSGLTDESEAVRVAFVRALGQLAPRAQVASLMAALDDPSVRVAQAAAQVIGEARLVEAAAELKRLFARGDAASMQSALHALERLGALDDALVAAATEQPGGDVARRALELAAARPGGLTLLEARLKHPRWEVRRAAARVAGRAFGAEATPRLERLLADETDALVVEALSRAIELTQARARG